MAQEAFSLLKDRLSELAGAFSDLEMALRQPEHIEPLDCPTLKTRRRPDGVSVDREALWNTVSQYRSALKEKARLETSLEQAGLGVLTRPEGGSE